MSDTEAPSTPEPKFDMYLTISCGDGHAIYAFRTEEEALDQLVAWATADGSVGSGEGQETAEAIRDAGTYYDPDGYCAWVEPHRWATVATSAQ